MVRELTSERRGPQKADAAAVFLHGYGSDGADLMGLADPLAPHLPGTAFYAPNAPDPCVNNPMGYQWFPIPWMDGSTEAQAKASMALSTDDLNAFLDRVLTDEGLTPDRLVIFGFSQGTMMALHVLPRRDQPVAGIVGCSGLLLLPELLAAETQAKPPVLLIHGDQDEMVPFANMELAADALNATGFEVYGHVMKGTGHGIAPDGLSAALGFMKQVLGK